MVFSEIKKTGKRAMKYENLEIVIRFHGLTIHESATKGALSFLR